MSKQKDILSLYVLQCKRQASCYKCTLPVSKQTVLQKDGFAEGANKLETGFQVANEGHGMSLCMCTS